MHTPPSVPRRAWLILVLTGLAGALFYLDRQVLSVLKTTLKTDQGWSDIDYGWLVSVFMVCYTGCYLFTGRWIDRWGTRCTLALFVGLMSLGMLTCALAPGLPQMAVGRGILGFAEAGIMPATMVAIFAWFPPSRRGGPATGLTPIYVGGQVLAAPLVALVVRFWNWRWAFGVPAVAGLLLVPVWWWADQPRAPQAATAHEPPFGYRDVLKRRAIWGLLAARLISDPLWFFFLYWEPGYLQERLGFSLAQVAYIGWIPTIAATVALFVCGLFSDRMVSRFGFRPADSRRLILQALAALAPLLLLLRESRNPPATLALLSLVRIMMVVWLSFTNILMADLVPQRMIATAVAIMSGLGSATALVCNGFVGRAIAVFGYGTIFTVGAVLHPTAALILWLYYGRARRDRGNASSGTQDDQADEAI